MSTVLSDLIGMQYGATYKQCNGIIIRFLTSISLTFFLAIDDSIRSLELHAREFSVLMTLLSNSTSNRLVAEAVVYQLFTAPSPQAEVSLTVFCRIASDDFILKCKNGTG